MPDCERMNSCPYYETDLMKAFPSMLEKRQREYCKGDNSKCARYIVFNELGEKYVPKDLLPIDVDRARAILDEESGDSSANKPNPADG